jgi:hypothetical protein
MELPSASAGVGGLRDRASHFGGNVQKRFGLASLQAFQPAE